MKWWGWGDEDKNYDLTNRPDFWPYLRHRLGIQHDRHTPPVSVEDIQLPPPQYPLELQNALQKIIQPEQIATDKITRLLHSYGKSYRDLMRIRQGHVRRSPDCIIYPKSQPEVEAIVRIADQHHAELIPFGGGTSVVGGVEPRANSDRTSMTLNMRHMNRILSVDRKSGTAKIEAGILGPELENQLQSQGLTLGHYPQSFEFSTLGGWVAARSAGQQSNRYGAIEEMVKALQMVTPDGTLKTLDVPASASGPALKHIAIGSEGVLGVLTELTMRIHEMPKTQDYRGVLFQNFSQGLEAIRHFVQTGHIPAMVRLSDEEETAALFKLREPTHSPFKKGFQKLIKNWLEKAKNFDFNQASLMLLGFEGNTEQVQQDRQAVMAQCGGALHMGTSVGEHWYRSRFELPYLRDTLLDHGILIDTLETATTWSNLSHLYREVRLALEESILATGYPPLILCHVSHVYHEGASLYFTFLCQQAIGHELEQWELIKQAATDTISQHGGTISHHHGVGYEHSPWLTQEVSSTGIHILQSIKNSLDPNHILNPGKLLPVVKS